MRHSPRLLGAVKAALIESSGQSLKENAVAILDAVRAAEAEEMKTDRQALVDTIAEEVGKFDAYQRNATACMAVGSDVADAILADFHVSLKADVTEPIR